MDSAAVWAASVELAVSVAITRTVTFFSQSLLFSAYFSFMWRIVALFLTSSIAFAGDKFSDPDPGSFDVEPPSLIPDRDKQPLAESGSPNDSPRDVDLAKLEKQFERAKRNLAGLDKLLKIGALSKLEVEQRRLRVVHLEFELANAQLIVAKEQMLHRDQQLSAGEIAKTDVTPTENNLALAIAAAHTASAKREQADIDAAEANVRRQEKLYVLGSARKSDVARAQQKLADLRGQGN